MKIVNLSASTMSIAALISQLSTQRRDFNQLSDTLNDMSWEDHGEYHNSTSVKKSVKLLKKYGYHINSNDAGIIGSQYAASRIEENVLVDVIPVYNEEDIYSIIDLVHPSSCWNRGKSRKDAGKYMLQSTGQFYAIIITDVNGDNIGRMWMQEQMGNYFCFNLYFQDDSVLESNKKHFIKQIASAASGHDGKWYELESNLPDKTKIYINPYGLMSEDYAPLDIDLQDYICSCPKCGSKLTQYDRTETWQGESLCYDCAEDIRIRMGNRMKRYISQRNLEDLVHIQEILDNDTW